MERVLCAGLRIGGTLNSMNTVMQVNRSYGTMQLDSKREKRLLI